MEKQVKEAIRLIEKVRETMPESENKMLLKGAVNELEEALSKFNIAFIEPKFNSDDYIVLNPVGALSYLAKDEIAVGVKNFTLMGKPCLMEYTFEGKKYKRNRTAIIPFDLIGKICSAQVYKLIKD